MRISILGFVLFLGCAVLALVSCQAPSGNPSGPTQMVNVPGTNTFTPTITSTPTITDTPTVTATPYGEVFIQCHLGGDYNPANPFADAPLTLNYLDQSGVTQTQPTTLICYSLSGSQVASSTLQTPIHGNYYAQVVFPGSNDWCQYYGTSPNWYGVNSVNIYVEAVYGSSASILATCSQNVTFFEATGWTYPSTVLTVNCSGSLP